MTSLVEVGVEEAGAGRLEVDPHVRDRRARLEILIPELGDLLGRDEHSGRLPWRRASPRRRGWRAEPKRWRPRQILVFKPDFQPFGPRPGRGQYYLPDSRQQPEARGT